MQPARNFSYPAADGRVLSVRASLTAGRAGPVFSVVGDDRTSYEDIVDAAPDEVFEDLRALVTMSGRGLDGKPPLPAQAGLYLRKGDVHNAHWELRGSATLDELLAISDDCAAAFADRGSPLFTDAEGRAVEAARHVVVADDALAAVPADAPDEVRQAALGMLHRTLVTLDHALVAMPRSEVDALDDRTVARHGRLTLMGRMDRVARDTAADGRLPEDRMERLRTAVEKRYASDALERFVDATLAARWAAGADAAMEALRRPDYAMAPSPDREDVPLTADAFARSNRLDFDAYKPRPVGDAGERTFDWQCRVKAGKPEGPVSFRMASRLRPTWADLASLVRDEPGHPVAVAVAGLIGDDLAGGLAQTRERGHAAEPDAPGPGM